MPIRTPIDLGAKIKIRSREDLESAMIVLRSVSSQSQQLHARRNAKVADLDAELAEKDCVTIGEASLPCSVYTESLEAAIVEFLESGPAELAGQRTITMPAGSIEIRKNPDKIDAVKGKTKDALTKAALEKINADDAATTFLEGFGLSEFYRIELKPDLSGMKALLEKKKLTREQLRGAGYRTLAGEDRIEIKVGD
ncbi:hypothetical protein [Planctomyces sp. SH-PL14]|uniref:hypothetical protein n=1 Tax=Planctomyces sp. SH-PL14 TaxID=1632864 RepID=UPI00078D4E11|nr:hypothetical protein [Planctomyces sp. SH-PL14]AMV18874.1 Bacteriophage Mu Gam like protein [Planctomyces sp. SH-PL14]